MIGAAMRSCSSLATLVTSVAEVARQSFAMGAVPCLGIAAASGITISSTAPACATAGPTENGAPVLLLQTSPPFASNPYSTPAALAT